MKVQITFNVDDRTRQALCEHYGLPGRYGLATAAELRAEIKAAIAQHWADVRSAKGGPGESR